jgi:hypothetical protein
MLLHTSPLLAASIPVPAVSPHEQHGQTADADANAEWTATTVGILNEQGRRGAETLQLIAGVEVPNLAPKSPPVIDVVMTRQAEANLVATAEANAAATFKASLAATAEANAAATATAAAEAVLTANANATATAVAERELALAVAATVEARERAEAASALVAASARREREAEAQATTDARATQAAQAAAAAAAPVQNEVPVRYPLPLLAASLFAVILGALGALIWRRHQEPFVLKAKPVPA